MARTMRAPHDVARYVSSWLIILATTSHRRHGLRRLLHSSLARSGLIWSSSPQVGLGRLWANTDGNRPNINCNRRVVRRSRCVVCFFGQFGGGPGLARIRPFCGDSDKCEGIFDNLRDEIHGIEIIPNRRFGMISTRVGPMHAMQCSGPAVLAELCCRSAPCFVVFSAIRGTALCSAPCLPCRPRFG